MCWVFWDFRWETSHSGHAMGHNSIAKELGDAASGFFADAPGPESSREQV